MGAVSKLFQPAGETGHSSSEPGAGKKHSLAWSCAGTLLKSLGATSAHPTAFFQVCPYPCKSPRELSVLQYNTVMLHIPGPMSICFVPIKRFLSNVLRVPVGQKQDL